MTQLTPQHLLSRLAQNGSYLTAQAAAPLTNLAISINCFNHFAPKKPLANGLAGKADSVAGSAWHARLWQAWI